MTPSLIQALDLWQIGLSALFYWKNNDFTKLWRKLWFEKCTLPACWRHHVIVPAVGVSVCWESSVKRLQTLQYLAKCSENSWEKFHNGILFYQVFYTVPSSLHFSSPLPILYEFKALRADARLEPQVLRFWLC